MITSFECKAINDYCVYILGFFKKKSLVMDGK